MKYRQTVARTDSPPTGWTKPKLSDCIHMKSGDMITAKRIFEVEAYPVYGGNGLRGFTDRFNREGAHSLIGRQGALCGAVHFADGQFYASEHAIVAKALGKNDQRFLTYVLDALNLNEVSEASAQPGLSVEKLRSIEILCPTSPDEQQAIAAALSDADGVVAGLERVIAKKRLIKQGAMQDLLTARRRLPGFSGEWEEREIDSIALILDNLRVPLNDTQRKAIPGSIPYCGANGVVDHVGQHLIDDDVILMAEDGGYFDEYQTRPIAYRMIGKIWVNNHAHVLKARAGFDHGFLFHSLRHKDITPFLASGTRAKLNKGELKKISIFAPKDEREQATIAALLNDMDTEIQTLESRLAKARAVKEGMMQTLLTGRVRLV